jgi:hypothetical protein
MNARGPAVALTIALLYLGVAGKFGPRALGLAATTPLQPQVLAGVIAPVPQVYSKAFTGNTPFHHTVAELMSAGAKVVSDSSNNMAANYLSQGISGGQPLRLVGGGNVGPLYIAHEGDPAYIFSCPAYGKCNAHGKTVRYPPGAHAHTDSDHHLSTIDFASGIEVDGWGGYTPDGVRGSCDGNLTPTSACPYPCNLVPGSNGNPGTANCSWGGSFKLNGDGLASVYGNAGNAGGYAFGIMNITAGEILEGHIDHALGIAQSCLDANTVYPSDHPGTDARCSGNTAPYYNNFNEPQPSYGNLIHLKSSVDVTTLAASGSCQTILRALQKYGAYTADNNGKYGILLNIEDATDQYGGNVAANPWFTTILPDMVAYGDASATGNENSPFTYQSCLGKITADQIEIIQISPTLPPQ